MCMHFITYWPAIPNFKLCGFTKAPKYYGTNSSKTLCGNRLFDVLDMVSTFPLPIIIKKLEKLF